MHDVLSEGEIGRSRTRNVLDMGYIDRIKDREIMNNLREILFHLPIPLFRDDETRELGETLDFYLCHKNIFV
jgi:hypothetical protein